MKAAKQLRKPEHWQDFERLAQKLWGEVWQCRHTIKRHGRNGQAQSGVDVYDIPKGETKYWGVQCKGKDEYTHAQLTIKQIDDEIAEAETFNPPLAMYIIATTANRDASVQEHVRIRNAERRAKGLFGVDVCAWEDIVELLDEHPEALNWYLGASNISDAFDAFVGVDDGELVTIIEPEYIRKTINYKVLERLPDFSRPTSELSLHDVLANMRMTPMPTLFGGPSDQAWCEVEFTLENTGSKVIEDWRLNLYFPKDSFEDLSDGLSLSMRLDKDWKSWKTVFVYEDDGQVLLKPLENQPLVQKSRRAFSVHILPTMGLETIKVAYRLLARDFDKSGELEIRVQPRYEEKREFQHVLTEPLPEEKIVIEKKLA